MAVFTGWSLLWPRQVGQRFFLQFGLHCATHQIRVILISCVVITSLFYPALDLYTSSRDASQSILDAITSPTSARVENDLVNLWAAQDSIRVYEDPVTRAKCRDGQALRVERIFIQSPVDEDDGALNNEILLSALDLERWLEPVAASSNCLKNPSGQCLVISPLAFWNYDKHTLSTDPNILDTLSYAKNVSVGRIPITPHMVLAGRGSFEHPVGPVGGNKYDYASFLALTYFFPNNACWGSGVEHAQWVQTIQNTIAQDEEVPGNAEATLIALEYDPHRGEAKTKGWSAISAFLYLAYIGFFAYVIWSVRRMDAVHSRVGVTFTALVEIAVSTVTSLSVCALVGFKITMVPWELLPIVIAFVGAENMFNLVDAIGKTSVTLSVKQRIAEGLSRAGTSNTLKVVSYNSILGVIAVFGVGAVRQFCIFAIVVLVAHWFLAHTFFIAVLSIDIARLELEELLRHDINLAPSVPQAGKESQNSKQPRSAWQKLIMATQSLLKGRAATNISLLMLLAIAGTLYYTTYTASTSTLMPSRIPKPLGAVSRAKAKASPDMISTAEHIWKTLNPKQAPLLHVRIELPTILTFSPNAGRTSGTVFTMPSSYRSRYTMRTFKFVLWMLTIMVLPIAATTSALYGLLLYLLKNTELLEAQRHHPEGEDVPFAQDDERSLQDDISFSTLPRAFASDVELIGASKDGKTVVSVGLHNEIIIWNADTKKHIAIDASNALLRTASTSSCLMSTVTSITVDDAGEHFAVGTGAGLIATWSLNKVTGAVRPLPLLALENSSAGVTEMRFVPKITQYTSKKPTRTSPTTEPNSPSSQYTGNTVLLATYENGVAARWTIGEEPLLAYFSSSRSVSVTRSLLVDVIPENRVLVAFCLEDGGLDLVQTGDYEPIMLADCSIQPGNSMDVVYKVNACRAEMNGSMRLVVAVATESGTISLWDGLTGECISVLEDSYGHINRLRLSPVECQTCHFCGQLPMESLSVAFSVDHTIRFFKLYLDDQTRRCSCSRAHHHQQQQLNPVSSRENIGRRSRSNSTASSQMSSPLMPRARLATAFETSAFPVSGHGVHSRRASDKETTRRSTELLTVPFPGNLAGSEGCESAGYSYDHSGSTTPTNASHSVWRKAVLIPLVDVTCERGGWDVSRKKFVGIRRKPRSQGKKPMSSVEVVGTSTVTLLSGLTSATLERWELWTFDPAMALLRSSLLSALSLQPMDGTRTSTSSSRSSSFDSQSSSTGIARLPFTRVSPLLIAPSHALAGFGNTIGVFNFNYEA